MSVNRVVPLNIIVVVGNEYVPQVRAPIIAVYKHTVSHSYCMHTCID